MILADTSVWIGHLRARNETLAARLEQGLILSHPFVIGELALGRLIRRAEVLAWLGGLPSAETATHGEVMTLIERHRLAGRGVGWVDAHLLAATLITPGASLWTYDASLQRVASELGVAVAIP